MLKKIVVGTLSLLIISIALVGCAGLDNGFGRTAVPIPAKMVSSTVKLGSSYSPAKSFCFHPDSINVNQETKYDLLANGLIAQDIGLGKGLVFGYEWALTLSPDKEFAGYEDYEEPTISPHVKLHLQYSKKVSPYTWLAVAPTYVRRKEVLAPQRRIRYNSDCEGFEIPLTISFVQPYLTTQAINSFTFRYSELCYNGDLRYEGTEPWSQYYYPKPQRNYVHRYAAIYTFSHENTKLMKQKHFDLGLELTYRKDTLILAPVFGVRLSLDGFNLLKTYK